MPNLVVDFPTALTILAGIVKDFGPDHIGRTTDRACYFVPNEDDQFGQAYPDTLNLEPMCIVGQAFHRLGISRVLLTDSSKGSSQESICEPGFDMWSRAEQFGVTFNIDAQMLFRDAQEAQDNNEPWGKAVRTGVQKCRNRAQNALPQYSDKVGDIMSDLPTVSD